MKNIIGVKITRVNQLGEYYTKNDGLGMCSPLGYKIMNCTIDMADDDCDEATAVTWGANATFNNCIIKNAGKLVLCGSGDKEKAQLENEQKVYFENCILENFGRRGPEVQAGMKVFMNNCLIKNWADPEFFDVRSFGAWAHHGGEIYAQNCVFWQDEFRFNIADFLCHAWQSLVDESIISMWFPTKYIPGCCRGLTSGRDGYVKARHCYKNKWWIRLENHFDPMSRDEAEELIIKLRCVCGA